MNKRYSQLWVDPKFAKKFKLEAVNHNMKLVDYSRFISDDADDIYERLKSKRKGGIDFKL